MNNCTHCIIQISECIGDDKYFCIKQNDDFFYKKDKIDLKIDY